MSFRKLGGWGKSSSSTSGLFSPLASMRQTRLTSVTNSSLPLKQMPFGSSNPVAKSFTWSPSITFTTPSPSTSEAFITEM